MDWGEMDLVNIEDTDRYAIIGSRNHLGHVPNVLIGTLASALKDAEALKVEGSEEAMNHASLKSPKSAMSLSKSYMEGKPVSYIPETGEHDLGFYLLNYGVPKQIVETSLPLELLLITGGEISLTELILEKLPSFCVGMRKVIGFIDIGRVVENFLRISTHWNENGHDPKQLLYFPNEFEYYMSKIREHEFWKYDLERFREDYSGKIAVCCGNAHTGFVRRVLEGKPVEAPKIWSDYLASLPQKTQDIFREVAKALEEKQENNNRNH